MSIAILRFFVSHNSIFRIIFELIKGEQVYVKDLENIEKVRSICYVSTSQLKFLLPDVHPTSACCRATSHPAGEA